MDGQRQWQVVLARLCFLTSCPLRPVHPEDSTEHAQKQGHLQEDQEQEVDTAEQGPVGDMVMVMHSEPHDHHPSHPPTPI